MKLYKIVQLLRLSRLVLLVILLLIAVAAKIARADTAVLYYASRGNVEGKLAGEPLAACRLYYPDVLSVKVHQNGRSGSCIGKNAYGSEIGLGLFSSLEKTCDAKELTHNGSELDYHGENSDLLNNVFWLNAPPGIDAKDWYSDRFTTCENNCIVRNSRDPFFPKSVNESDGTSRAAFNKKQTGEVCVVEKKKPDDPPKPPAPDHGDGTDGNGQSGAGSDNGQGNGSDNSQGSGGESGDSGQTGSDGGNSNDSGSNSSGSGGGSGGSSGGSLQIGPGGNSNGGGSPGGSEGEGSQGSDGDGQSGDGQNGSGSGDSGGQSGGEGSGEGVEGSQNSNNGQSGAAGQGDGNGEGSISGGSCELNQAPACKGDPVQCYIAREQWRTACAALGNKSEIKGSGNCRTQTPPECKGDATQCYIVKQQFLEACARQSLEDYGSEQAANAQSYIDGDGFDAIGEAIGDNDSIVNVPSQLNTSGYGLTRTCPTLQFDIDVALFGSFRLDFSVLCGLANLLGNLFVVASLVISARYILR